MSQNCDFEWAGGIFWCEIWCFRCAARTVEHEFELHKWLVELVSKSNSTFRTRFRESAGKVWQRAGQKNRTNLVIEKLRFGGFLELHVFAQIENRICKYYKLRRTSQIKRERTVSLKNCKTKIHIWPQPGTWAEIQVLRDLVAHFGSKFCVSAALRALSSTNSDCTSDS